MTNIIRDLYDRIWWKHICWDQQPYERYEVQRHRFTGEWRHRGRGYSGKVRQDWYPHATLKCSNSNCGKQHFCGRRRCTECHELLVPMEAASYDWYCGVCDAYIDRQDIICMGSGYAHHAHIVVELHYITYDGRENQITNLGW